MTLILYYSYVLYKCTHIYLYTYTEIIAALDKTFHSYGIIDHTCVYYHRIAIGYIVISNSTDFRLAHSNSFNSELIFPPKIVYVNCLILRFLERYWNCYIAPCRLIEARLRTFFLISPIT